MSSHEQPALQPSHSNFVLRHSFEFRHSSFVIPSCAMNSQSPTPPPLWEIEFRVMEITSEQTSIPRERIRSDSRLLEDLHIDSLTMVEVILSIEEKFKVSIPDDIGKQMFVRSPLTISALAEIVRHQWGTGVLERKRWFGPRPKQVAPMTIPFTQLGGVPCKREWLDGPLYEAMASTAEGFSQFRRRTDGMRCVLVPAAEVELGSCASDGSEDEHPKHQVRMDSFLIDAEPVSVSAFARFLNSTGNPGPPGVREWCGVAEDDRRRAHFQLQNGANSWEPVPGTERQPMVLVSWYGSAAYSLWANRRDWRAYRDGGLLPTEAQWEYAARGPTNRLFPWGDEPLTPDRALVGLHRARTAYGSILPLAEVQARLGISPFGLHHMAGNVWQWCADWYAANFYSRAEASRSNPLNSCPTGIRCERGGSWIGPADLARSSYRRGRPSAARGRCLGFRCVGLLEDIQK
jgi:sulfatase modifying factor 1